MAHVDTGPIPITRPTIGDTELEAVSAVLRSGFLVQGPRVEEFERLVADTAGCGHAVALSNCTAALRVALLAIGIGDGDRVAVTSYSWIATANVIALVGATPVFVDVDSTNFNMDPTALERVLQADEGVRAVIAVDTFGNPAGMETLDSLARDAGVPLIEDAACRARCLDQWACGGVLRCRWLLQLPSSQNHHDRRRRNAGHR